MQREILEFLSFPFNLSCQSFIKMACIETIKIDQMSDFDFSKRSPRGWHLIFFKSLFYALLYFIYGFYFISGTFSGRLGRDTDFLGNVCCILAAKMTLLHKILGVSS